ncbi:hypothetical protein SB775_13975 [Peribacillus sp. SIMBA_075]|uniref:hypothetical protein n=1 Tax=Peribacillus sp. SIMBA_075 TaxID=3085813 RepID=UPI0039794536
MEELPEFAVGNGRFNEEYIILKSGDVHHGKNANMYGKSTFLIVSPYGSILRFEGW